MTVFMSFAIFGALSVVMSAIFVYYDMAKTFRMFNFVGLITCFLALAFALPSALNRFPSISSVREFVADQDSMAVVFTGLIALALIVRFVQVVLDRRKKADPTEH